MSQKRKLKTTEYDDDESDKENVDTNSNANAKAAATKVPRNKKVCSSASAKCDQQSQLLNLQLLLSTPDECKSNIQVSGQVKELPVIPGVHVTDFGHVSSPLYESAAADLMEHASNESSDVYEIKASSIQIKNPAWTTCFDSFVNKVGQDLGLCGKIEAKLSKLLVFKTGSHMAKQKNTPGNNKNKFGTLLVQMPSIFSGREILKILIYYSARNS